MKNCLSVFIKYLFVNVWVLLAVFSCPVFGQESDSIYKTPTRDTIPVDSLSLPRTGGAPPLDSIPSLPDSLRRPVVVGRTDPLDTLSNRLFAYQVLSRNSYARTQAPIDTTLSRFDINNPVMRNYHAGAHLGNIGLSYYPIGFEARKRPSDFPFLDHLAVYLHDPEETVYYQTQSPYTHIDYSSGGPKIQNETIFNLIHTQNVNKNLNVGLHYDVYASAGQYNNQNSSNNAISLFSAYRGSQYSMYTNFNWNNVRMRENGGLENIDDYLVNVEEPPSNVVRSLEGKTILLNRSFYLMHSYSPRKLFSEQHTDSVDVSRFSLVQTLKYEWNKREYSDNAIYPLQGRDPWFGWSAPERAVTRDSLYFRRLSNHFELMIKEQSRRRFTAGFSAGLLTEFDRYNINIVPDTIIKVIDRHVPQNTGWGGDLPMISGEERTIFYRNSHNYVNTAITGRFFNHTGRFLSWDFNGRLYFTGYKMGNLNINGTVQMHYYTPNGRNSLLFGGSIDNAQPGYFMKRYASNLLAWDNNFNPSQEIRLRGEFLMPHRKLKLGAYVSQLYNYIYINQDAVPAQSSELLATGTAYVEKDIRWRKFGFRFRLYGQYSSNEKIIPLPAFAGYQSTYFESWLVKDVLTMQLGWNVTFNTKYYAYAYMPATSMFHLQEEQKIGNYPFFDFFLNFQINRARIFFKTDGLNTLLSNYLGKENFMVYRYPTNDFRMKFGVSWAFYD